MDSLENQPKKRSEFISVLKWAVFIFFVLLILTVSIGLSPLGVIELNNAFFSLFIHDERGEVLNQTSGMPDVSLLSGVPTNAETVTSASGRPSVSVGGRDVTNVHFPIRIIIPKTNLDARILNPESENLDVLNDALLYGAVRYPLSGTLESDKNILLFGHSSNLPVVHNQNFKVFLGVKNLVKGDEVILESKGVGYRYEVENVRLTDAQSEVVTFSNDHKLILSTCNTLGAHEDRYVAVARFVGSYPIAN